MKLVSSAGVSHGRSTELQEEKPTVAEESKVCFLNICNKKKKKSRLIFSLSAAVSAKVPTSTVMNHDCNLLFDC